MLICSIFVSLFIPLMTCRLFSCTPPLLPVACLFFFLMIRRPPRSTLDRSSAASDVYKRQLQNRRSRPPAEHPAPQHSLHTRRTASLLCLPPCQKRGPVSYTHLRAHETVLDLVCRLLLEKKKKKSNKKKITMSKVAPR